MKQNWVHKFYSFEEADEFDRKYYRNMSVAERLSIVQELRELYLQFCKQNKEEIFSHARRKRLQRIVKVIQQK